MLSDEEKEAIEVLKEDIEVYKQKGAWKENSIFVKALRTILNLIEKQSKEIEGLKKHKQILNNAKFGKFPYDKNYQVKIEAGRQQGKSFRAGMEFSNKIWEDKIKAKIEELDKEYKEAYNKGFKTDMVNRLREIKLMKSFLEKEE